VTVQTFRVLSALLCYPDPELLDALDELSEVLDAERALPYAARRALDGFMARLGDTDPLDAQERYVALFDRNRSLSLHLYEHVHGESRERGEAMVRLATLYKLHGLHIAANELPDYLPLYLEFLSLQPDTAARSLLAEAVHVIAALADKLEARNSPYAAVLRAIEALAARPADVEAVEEVRGKLDPVADDLATLDRQWEDEVVRFTAAGLENAAANGA
jgi:nitrate reductase molybdenum cofactor assembly chaperone NarJ/NarW